MYIGSDSLGLIRMAAIAAHEAAARPTPENGGPERRVRVLDLCTGSGVQGIAFARLMALRGASAAVTCADINPRAARFARFNAALNGLDAETAGDCGVEVRLGDLYAAVASPAPEDADAPFDVVLANPPFVPVPQELNAGVMRYGLFADGGGLANALLKSLRFRWFLWLPAPLSSLLSPLSELHAAHA